MQKTFCDLCGEPASRFEVIDATLQDKVLSDKSAKIVISIMARFTNHSSGYGGPPDLCNACVNQAILGICNELKASENSRSRLNKSFKKDKSDK
jgi:hypothetical protein